MFMPSSPPPLSIAAASNPCYGFRLRLHPTDTSGSTRNGRTFLCNIIGGKCHELYSWGLNGGNQSVIRPLLLLTLLGLALPVCGQQRKIRTPRPGAPDANFVNVDADRQTQDGQLYHLRGNARVETTDSLLTADEVDYNDDTKVALARGHVHFENYVNGDKLDCDHAEYNVDSETGKFYLVRGTSPTKVQSRPGILTSS